MIYIHFIINPISGRGNNFISLQLIEKYLPESKYKIKIDYTQYKKHAIHLAQKIVDQNPHYIIACGGDGTINEVASCIVGKPIKLGIIPLGSGNGLAAHLNIPRNLEKAIEIIKRGNHTSIDVGKVNEKYFFCSMGIGIDALIIKNYEQSKMRMQKAYAIAAFRAVFSFKGQLCIIELEKKTSHIKPYLLFISNTNEMGYKLTLTPKANLEDGWLDLVFVSELYLFQRIILFYYIFTHNIEKYKKAKHSLIQNLSLEIPQTTNIEAQVDGEIYNPKTNKLEISIIRKGISVISNCKSTDSDT